MASINSYRTSDSSRKITTYIFNNSTYRFAFDFGSNDIPLNDVKKLDYIFITHEHSDHFMGLYNFEYAEALLESKCKIYASNVTKDLINAIFENVIRVDLDDRSTKKIRDLLKKITGVLFYEKYELKKGVYFKIFPSGHTFGSSMIYLYDKDCKILYTGDVDYSDDDSDRQYQLELNENEHVDYIIADGTYLDSEQFKDEELTQIRDNILNKKHNKFFCRPEKIIFFSKKLISMNKLKDKYCVVFSSEFKWYLEILKKYNYDPFIVDKIVLELDGYYLPENRKPLRVSSKRTEKQTSVTSLVGLHIGFMDFAYFLQQFDPSKTKVLIGHYNQGKEKDILQTFNLSTYTSDYKVRVLKDGELEL